MLDTLSVLHTYCKYILIEVRFKKCLPFLPARKVYKFPPPWSPGVPPLGLPFLFRYAPLFAKRASATKIKLGTGICLVPEHNPLLLAKETATLDHYSGVRFLFGIRAG